jgi:hypothetical protein
MYRIEDIEKIKININDIQEKAIISYKSNFEPTLIESKEIYKYILEYIKNKKRLIYGGFAQNHLIKIKNADDVFYKESDVPDIEFYSYEPLVDVIELCDFLKNKNFKYIQSKGGIHDGTYKIFVNFINYCDISYISKNIYDKCLKIESNDLLFVHPHFMMIDTYRVFTDPLTSYWRLDKTFYRFLKLIKNYPILQNENTGIIIKNTSPDILNIIRKNIIHNSKLIIIGKYAYNYYIKKISNDVINIDYYELISIDYEKDINEIYNILNKFFKNKITTKEFSPFFEFFDKRIEFYLDNKLILKVFGNNNRCIVNRFSKKKKCYFGTYQLVFLYLLNNYNYYIINKYENEVTNTLNMMFNINKMKNLYLDKHNKTVLDKTPFEEFVINCIGQPFDPIRESFISMYEKRKKHLKINFNYEPSNIPGKIPNYNFDNKSGNEIINNKSQKLIKNKNI